MKMLNDLFKVIRTTSNEGGFNATIELDPKHIIFSAHFPGQPVTPGVIQLQMVHELLEKHFNRNLKLGTISQCKFLKIINPIETDQLNIRVNFVQENKSISIDAKGENGTDIFFKLRSNYRIC